jgi:hypothetical protein
MLFPPYQFYANEKLAAFREEDLLRKARRRALQQLVQPSRQSWLSRSFGRVERPHAGESQPAQTGPATRTSLRRSRHF